MNDTHLEIAVTALEKPIRITRRSFIKRTSTTVIVTALALHAFRSEALAANAGSSSGRETIKVTAWPPCVCLSESIMQIDNQEWLDTGTWDGKTVSLYTKGEVSPDYIEPDGSGNYLYSSFSIVFTFTVTIRNGTSIVYNGSGTLSSSVWATRGAEDTIIGDASPLNDGLLAAQSARVLCS